MSKQEPDVFKLADGYVHGLLSPKDARYVEQQCALSSVWAAAVDEARKRHELLQATTPTEASQELIQSTIKRIDDYERSTGRRKRFVVRTFLYSAAAAIAVVGTIHLYYLTLSATPYDLRVLGQTELMADTTASLRVQLFDRDHDRGVADVPVTIELRNPRSGKAVRLAGFRTTANGTEQPRFRLPDWTDGEYELRVSANIRGSREEITKTIKLKRSWKLMLSTDKPVYQPGQTILGRSLALRKPDLKPVAGQNLVYSITDPKGNVIFKQRDVTSEFGIASFECPLATEIIEGPYTIEAAVGDTASRLAVEVNKYVLPKFKTVVELDQTYYEPGQSVRGTLQADYFFGKPVVGASVRIQASATDVTETIFRDTLVETDAAGHATFSFNLPDRLMGREQESGDAAIAAKVTVTDSAGQEVSKRITRVVTVNPIRVEVIPEGGELVLGLANTIYLFSSYADGRPAQARVAVSGLERELDTDKFGVTSFELTPSTGKIDLSVRATDDQGRVGRRHVELACGLNRRDFLIRTDKAVYNGGDTINLIALGGGSQPVFIDFIKDGQTILTEVMDLTDGRGEHQFDLPPDLFGTLELVAYRFSEAGLPVRKSRVLYVRQAGELTVESRLDLDEYRPGGTAKLTLAVTDSTGRPTPGAVSLAAVDEAVFGVLDQSPGMEGRFFTLEQELLQPVYAVYPWLPDLTTGRSGNEREELEKALFTRASNSRATRTGCSREAMLQKLVDTGSITERTLDVLNDPNLDELMQQFWVSDILRSVIEGPSQHSLNASTFPANDRMARIAREAGLQFAYRLWLGLGITLGMILIVFLCMISRRWGVVVLIGIVLVGGYTVLLPSLSRARELSKRLVAASNLKGIDTSLRIMEAEGTLPTTEEPDTATAAPVRVREWFPETLLWRPELITDDNGRVSIDVNLADSITTWRVSASAVSAEGDLGASSTAIRVFQPFFVDLNLPVALTRGDEITIPVVVYNYLDTVQPVELTLAEADWFEKLDAPTGRVELKPGEVRSVGYRIRVNRVGQHQLEITARGSGVADAVRRAIEVVPNGRRVEQVFSGTLNRPVELGFRLPDSAIEGSAKTIVKIYPTSFSQLVEGLDAIFKRPYGCFEQTSSTTYPNVLALDYLRRTGASVPEVQAKARQYIHLGYQRLLGFEVPGGGFDWFGRPPASRTLTAYGLMEFADMARVHDVDPSLIARTRQWLMRQRSADGSWPPSNKAMHVDPTRRGADATLSATAYTAWAVFGSGPPSTEAAATRAYLLSHDPQSIGDPYVLALVTNALAAMEPSGRSAQPYIARLDAIKQASPDGRLVWWEQARGARTTFHGSGRSAGIETTALATLAMLEAKGSPASIRGALAWLAEQKDSLGTFHSTQATVLALKALLAGTGRALGGEADRQIDVTLGSELVQTVRIPADQGEVVGQVDLSALVGPGDHRLGLTDRTESGAGYQVTFSYHVPSAAPTVSDGPLAIDIEYNRTELTVGDSVTARATVTNNAASVAPMVILDLPIPAGFRIDPATLDQMTTRDAIAKYQVNARSAVVYLRKLEPQVSLVLEYKLQATTPVNITVPPGRVYEYYDPDNTSSTAPTAVHVLPQT